MKHILKYFFLSICFLSLLYCQWGRNSNGNTNPQPDQDNNLNPSPPSDPYKKIKKDLKDKIGVKNITNQTIEKFNKLDKTNQDNLLKLIQDEKKKNQIDDTHFQNLSILFDKIDINDNKKNQDFKKKLLDKDTAEAFSELYNTKMAFIATKKKISENESKLSKEAAKELSNVYRTILQTNNNEIDIDITSAKELKDIQEMVSSNQNVSSSDFPISYWIRTAKKLSLLKPLVQIDKLLKEKDLESSNLPKSPGVININDEDGFNKLQEYANFLSKYKDKIDKNDDYSALNILDFLVIMRNKK